MTNSRGQLHAVYRQRARGQAVRRRAARDFVAGARHGRSPAGASSWVDLDLDGDLDLVLANGAIPVTSLAKDAEPRAGAREPDGGRACGDRSTRGVGLDGPRVTAVASRRPTTTTTATSTSRSTRSAARSRCCATTAPTGHWLEVTLRRFAPGRGRHGRPPGRPPARATSCTPAGATSPPRTRASTSGSATRRASSASSCAPGRPRRRASAMSPPTGSSRCGRPASVGQRRQPPQPGSRPAAPSVSSTTSIRRSTRARARGRAVRAAAGAAGRDRLADRPVLEVVLRVELVELGAGAARRGRR